MPKHNVSLPTHGLIELCLGLATMVAPLILGFGVAGLLVVASFGAILAGAGMVLSASPSAISAAGHREFDGVFALAAALAALLLALADSPAPASYIAAVAALLALLAFRTRYVTSR